MLDNFRPRDWRTQLLSGGGKHLPRIVASVSQAYALMRRALNLIKVVLVFENI